MADIQVVNIPYGQRVRIRLAAEKPGPLSMKILHFIVPF
jgi:hypothetical protein